MGGKLPESIETVAPLRARPGSIETRPLSVPVDANPEARHPTDDLSFTDYQARVARDIEAIEQACLAEGDYLVHDCESYPCVALLPRDAYRRDACVLPELATIMDAITIGDGMVTDNYIVVGRIEWMSDNSEFGGVPPETFDRVRYRATEAVSAYAHYFDRVPAPVD